MKKLVKKVKGFQGLASSNSQYPFGKLEHRDLGEDVGYELSIYLLDKDFEKMENDLCEEIADWKDQINNNRKKLTELRKFGSL